MFSPHKPGQHKVGQHRGCGRALACALAAALSGCSTQLAGALPGFLTTALLLLALPLCAGLAYALGHTLARQRSDEALRLARTALLQSEQLHGGWTWQTDAAHQLLSWRAPGQANINHCALFDNAPLDATLRQRLDTRQAFAGLRLRCQEALDGSRGWELRGLPRLNSEGAFAGFDGSARPTDDDDALRLAASALTPTLQVNAQPSVLAAQGARGWQVQQFNAAAAALWPELTPGCPLAQALAALPSALSQALAASPLQSCTLLGWQLSALGPTPGGAAALLLSQLADDSARARTQAFEGDTFSFTLSHDLRAPIRVVDGFTRIVKEDYGQQLDRVGNDHLDRVLGAAARMNLMIDALLALARLSEQPLARQRVNLSQLAGFVIDDLKRAGPERVLEVDIETGLAAWGDPTLLRMVLENLLGNAWKYSARVPVAQISLRSEMQGGQAGFVVRDNGAGFDMRSADRLFGLFQRLHSASDFAGHGVGLASVRRIVQRHGGEIWAEAEPGRGAAFHFSLPG